MFSAILLTLLLACHDQQPFPREIFEDTWWELEVYPTCFNLHESGLLTYEYDGPIYNEGNWSYEGEGQYYVEKEDITLRVSETDPPNDWRHAEKCWKIKGYHLQVLIACECTLRE